ncbi:hypothetical protein N7448_011145 [Penicillium atrosanguineum]|nr:hypothetical protein N7448_011145 [Penicillium atrosanguineum]
MDADHITGPLKRLLGEPDKAIIRRLKVLENRYTRYRSGLDIAGGLMFQVNTDFFTALSEQTPTAIAWKMTQDALKVFSKISVHGLMNHDDHLRQLAVQWDQINLNVEEIAAVGCLDDSLRGIAWNHFCLCAVLGGMAQAKLQVESTLTGFVDTKQNYRQYRLQLHIEPSLPFLYPFIVELRRGNREVLKDIFSCFPYEQFLHVVKEDNIAYKDGKLRIKDLDS